VTSSSTPLWRRPIWLLGHLIALLAVLGFVRAGLWQLDRLDEKKARNEVIAARADGEPVPIESVAPEASPYRRVLATGTFDAEHDLLLPQRSFEGNVGQHAVTPLVLSDGRAVLVNRGWVPLTETAPPPSGVVTIEGLLLPSQQSRVGTNVNRLSDEMGGIDLLPLWLSQTEPVLDDGYPVRLPEPARDEGPHLSYAIQWFLFAAVVLIGYPLLLSRRMRADRPT
jgi:cytochrome oxidase assembly protein ShyY1